jgi:hypothetical protein
MSSLPDDSSRRDFLKGSGSVLAGVTLGALTATADERPEQGKLREVVHKTSTKRDAAPAETAVIGGGIAGLYAAWRLTESGAKVRLFEGLERLGGRLLTVPIPGTRIRAELGAMRFTSHHRLLDGLAKVFKSEGVLTTEFGVSDTWFYHLRGRRLLGEDLEDGYCNRCNGPIPYQFHGWPQPESLRKTPGELVNYAMINALKHMSFGEGIRPADRESLQIRLKKLSRDGLNPDWGAMPKKDWTLIKEYGRVEGIPLRDTGFWNVLQHYLGNEGFQLVHDALGYESIVGNWNASEALPWFAADFAGDQKHLMIVGGFGLLVDKLEQRIQKRESKIDLNMSLLDIDRKQEGEYPWLLTFRSEDPAENVENVPIQAKRVILAIPRMPLEALVIRQGGKEHKDWGKIKDEKLPAVLPHRLFKVMLIFDSAWWEGLPPAWQGSATARRVITDLPIRQVYYFSPKWIEEHTPPVTNAPNWAMVMASYSDEHYVSFWRPFAPKGRENHHGVCQLPDRHSLTSEQVKALEALAKDRGVPHRMVEKLRRQLADLHGVDIGQIPEPIIGIYIDWGREPNEQGGWHTWEVNEECHTVAESLVQPLGEKEQLYICGEAYSSQQGWIEGALQSTERVLTRLKVAPPDWFGDSASAFASYIEF